MENCKISVIVPVYNCEKYLERCVNSILNQTYTNLEVILVDDGSPDNAGSLCDQFASYDNRVKVIHQENSGVSVARNNGIKIATGKWVSFIDSDDYILPDTYAELLWAGEKNDVDLVLSDLSMSQGEEKINVKINLEPNFIYNEESIKKDILPRFTHGGHENIGLFELKTKLYRLSIIKERNVLFPEQLSWSEDCYFSVKYMANVETLIYVDKEFYVYVPLPGGLYSRFNKDGYIESVKIYKIFSELIKEYDIQNINYENRAQTFIYQISWFLYRTKGRISDKKQRKELQKAVLSCEGVREILTECLGLLTSFDRRMAKAILSKRRSYAMFIIDFVYSGKKDKLLKLIKRG